MRIIDLHCYPGTSEWIRCQGPYEELGYSDEVMEKIFHKNAERILGL